jgi:hypothetical protein
MAANWEAVELHGLWGERRWRRCFGARRLDSADCNDERGTAKLLGMPVKLGEVSNNGEER